MQAKRTWGALAAGLVGLSIPGSASAATQIGETFNPTGGGPGAGATIIQTTSPLGQYAAPFAGVITSWSYQAPASDPPELKFKATRHAGANSFTIVGEDGPRTPTAGTLNTFPTRVPVLAGDVIGLYVSTSGLVVRAGGGVYFLHREFADSSPGTTSAFVLSGVSQQIDVSASLEPDADDDGFGDETQDRPLSLHANKAKVKKGKRVTLFGGIPAARQDGRCAASRPVELQRKGSSQTTFTTVEQLQTDPAGNFSAKKKVKKTFEYRAQVPETATCAGQTSNTEKVKVRKKN
jgi:hypothetical protein